MNQNWNQVYMYAICHLFGLLFQKVFKVLNLVSWKSWTFQKDHSFKMHELIKVFATLCSHYRKTQVMLFFSFVYYASFNVYQFSQIGTQLICLSENHCGRALFICQGLKSKFSLFPLHGPPISWMTIALLMTAKRRIHN